MSLIFLNYFFSRVYKPGCASLCLSRAQIPNTLVAFCTYLFFLGGILHTVSAVFGSIRKNRRIFTHLCHYYFQMTLFTEKIHLAVPRYALAEIEYQILWSHFVLICTFLGGISRTVSAVFGSIRKNQRIFTHFCH